jgi:VCBS repeat-containing protein
MANDGTVSGNTVIVRIKSTPVNDTPVAVADAYIGTEDTTLDATIGIGLLANDTDIDHDSLTAVLVDDVLNGALALAADGTFSYAPDLNFNGSDSFTYKANDGSLDSNIVIVTITIGAVNDAPVAVANMYTKAEDTTSTGHILTNDTDVEHDSLTAILVTDVSHGSLSLQADGSFTYTPVLNWNGTDSFTYQANDGTVSGNIAIVKIKTTPVNDAPIAVANMYTKPENTTWTGRTLANDIDVDNDSLTAILVTDVSHGTLSLRADGTFTYTPFLDFTGIDSFTYMANDGTVSSNIATVTIKITAVGAPLWGSGLR